MDRGRDAQRKAILVAIRQKVESGEVSQITAKTVIKALRLRLNIPPFSVFGDSSLPKAVQFVYNHLERWTDRPDLRQRSIFVNLLTRPIKFGLDVNKTFEPLIRSEGRATDWTSLPRTSQMLLRICFDFEETDWPNPAKAEGEVQKTGSKVVAIPFRNTHFSITIKGPAPYVSLLNVQTRVVRLDEFRVISVNARVLLINQTSFSLKVTPFAVRPPGRNKSPIQMPPLASPSVQAATITAEPEKKNEPVPRELAGAAGPSEAQKTALPYPLEIWHMLGTGDGDGYFVPYLALSHPSSDEYGCPLRLDLNGNNRRITVPLKSEGEVTNVTFNVQIEDRENGQQMVVTVGEASPDLLIHNKCEVPLLVTEFFAVGARAGRGMEEILFVLDTTDCEIVAGPSVSAPIEWLTKVPAASKAHLVLPADVRVRNPCDRYETYPMLTQFNKIGHYIGLRTKDGDNRSTLIRVDEGTQNCEVKIPNYGDVEVLLKDGTLTIIPANKSDGDIADDLKQKLSVTETH